MKNLSKKKANSKTKSFEWIDIMYNFNDVVDNGTTTVYIATPKGWKCKRNKCTANYKHTHTTYSCLKASVDNCG